MWKRASILQSLMNITMILSVLLGYWNTDEVFWMLQWNIILKIAFNQLPSKLMTTSWLQQWKNKKQKKSGKVVCLVLWSHFLLPSLWKRIFTFLWTAWHTQVKRCHKWQNTWIKVFALVSLHCWSYCCRLLSTEISF